MIKLIVLIPFTPILNHKSKIEIAKIHKNNHIYKPKDVKSCFYLPNLDLKNGEFIQNTIYYNKNYFENETLIKVKKYIQPGMRIMDIGANIGNHTCFFLNECGAEFVWDFEPTPATFYILCKNIEANSLCEKVSLNNVACGESESEGFIEKNNYDSGSNKVHVKENGDIKIISLDHFSKKEKVDFVKIDVEGFENQVLLGMKELIKRDKPIIYIEIWKDNFKNVEKIFNELEYKIEEKLSDMDYIYIKK